jgi:hypothetical protein
MKMGLFKKWKRKRRLKNILNEINVDPFYKLLKNFHEDLPDFSRISINDIQFREFKSTIKVTSVKDKFKEYRNEVKTEVPIEEKPRVVETEKEIIRNHGNLPEQHHTLEGCMTLHLRLFSLEMREHLKQN